mgnify:CR=1 FL=1
MLSKKKIYPYLVLIACAGLVAGTYGLVNIQGLFFDSISADLNIGKGVTAMYVTIIHISGSIFAPVGVSLRNKFSIRTILLITGILVVSALCIIPLAHSIYIIYLCAFIVGSGQGIYGHAMAVELINKWFEKASTFVSIALCASGIFGTVFSPIIVNSIIESGWRNAYYIFAIFLAVVLVYSIIVIEDKPTNIETKVDNKAQEKIICKETIFLSFFSLIGSSIAAISGYLLGYSGEIGLSMSDGALLSSAMSMGNLLLKLLFGVLCDILGGFKTSLIGASFIVIGAAILIISPLNVTLLIIAAFLLGATHSVSGVLTSAICIDLFGKRNVSKYYATITSLAMISSFSSTLIGFIYDASGSYKPSIAGFSVAICISLILVRFAFIIRNKKIN